MTGRPFSEDARKFVHIGFGACAFLLRWLDWWQAALLALVAVLFNVLVMPRAGNMIYRPADRVRRYAPGVVLYPVAVLLLVVIFPARPDIAAAAWGIMAFGDGMACLVGKRLGGPRIPWNRDKSLAGSTALFICGGTAGAVLAWWCRPPALPPDLWFPLGASFVAALAAALVETMPVRLDDNVSVPGTAAGVLWVLSCVDRTAAQGAASQAASLLLPALAVNVLVAWLGLHAATVTRAGAVTGALIGTLIFVTAGWAGWMLLLATFLIASASSRLGWQRKTLLGIAEERGGRRGPGNAIANTGFAAIAASMSAFTDARDPALLACVAALAAGGSDTVASEIGKAWGSRTYLVTTLRTVRPGTTGGVSLEGTVAGIAGALILAIIAFTLGLIPGAQLAPVVAGATIGAFAESALGATLEDSGILNNDLLNFLNTAIAAAAALLIARTWL